MTPRNRFVAVAAMVLGLGALFAGTASAHTTLVSSDPAKDAKVSSLSEVTLTFNESVKFVKVQVRDGSGGQHQAGQPVVQGGTVTQKLTGNLTVGSYTINYRVVSADGHPVQASVPFTVLAQALDTSPSPSAGASGDPGLGVAEVQGTAGTGSPPAQATSSGGGGSTKWIVGGAGLLAGIGLGLGFVVMRTRKKQPTSVD